MIRYVIYVATLTYVMLWYDMLTYVILRILYMLICWSCYAAIYWYMLCYGVLNIHDAMI